LKVGQTTIITTLPQTWRNKKLSVTGFNNKIVFCRKNAEMKSCISQSRIGLRRKSASKVKLLERMQTGTKLLSLKKREGLFAETGHLLISIQRTILLRKKHLLVVVKVKKF